MKKLASELRAENFETLNETTADEKAQALMDTGRHTSSSQKWYSCQNTAKVEAVVFYDKSAESVCEEKIEALA